MGNKTHRKLQLTRESVRRLGDRELGQVGGAKMNTYMQDGGNWCSTYVLSHCYTCGCPPTVSCLQTVCGC